MKLKIKDILDYYDAPLLLTAINTDTDERYIVIFGDANTEKYVAFKIEDLSYCKFMYGELDLRDIMESADKHYEVIVWTESHVVVTEIKKDEKNLPESGYFLEDMEYLFERERLSNMSKEEYDILKETITKSLDINDDKFNELHNIWIAYFTR